MIIRMETEPEYMPVGPESFNDILRYVKEHDEEISAKEATHFIDSLVEKYYQGAPEEIMRDAYWYLHGFMAGILSGMVLRKNPEYKERK